MVWCHEQDKKENNQNLVAEIGWQNWLFVWAKQNIYSGFTICRIYGGVMGDLTKIYTIIQPKMVWGYKKMGVITACKCKKITNDGCQKRNSKFFINFLCYFSNYVRPFGKLIHVPSSQVEKRVRDLLWEFLMVFCCTAVNLVFLW